MSITVAECNIYPLKSAKGISLTQSNISARGLNNDRLYMLVDEAGRFVTQRNHARMATISTVLNEQGLHFSTPNGEKLALSQAYLSSRRLMAAVWDDTCEVQIAADHVNQWFSAYLGTPLKLVHMPENVIRQTDPKYSRPADHVSFADGFPILITTRPSLGALKEHFKACIGMDRFRANIVLDGNESFAEDIWHYIKIGGVELELVKPCSRCVITTIDQTNGDKPSTEPITTLAQWRRGEKGVYFGMNAIPRTMGSISINDKVEILSTRPLSERLLTTRIHGQISPMP